MSGSFSKSSKSSSEKDRIRSLYGINNPVTEGYDDNLAAVCENGIFVGKMEDEITVFRGIPYAAPPVGDNRWKRPKPPVSDSEVYEAYYYGKSPIQTEWVTERASYYPIGEDCLYLNVWTAKGYKCDSRTVMVFFHGGSYGWGGTSDPLYDGKIFTQANPDIVMVTVGYRTGLMGFVDFSDVPGGEDYKDAPNLGLLDQIEALRWIKRNIAAFGGDPDNITIFGESAGAGSVSLLPIIPEAKGLFRRVIAESGSVALTFSKEECRPFTKRLLRESGVSTMEELLALTEEELININVKLNYYNNFPQRDGVLIPTDPYGSYRDGMAADIDMMIGTNANESNYWIGELGGIVPYRLSIPIKYENDMRSLPKNDAKIMKSFLKHSGKKEIWAMTEVYNELMFRLPAIRQAEYNAQNGGKVYMYYWTIPSAIPYMKACHAVELAYVFGNVWETIFTGEPADREISNQVMRMWANFARTGEPGENPVTWLPYDPDNRATMVFGKTMHMRNGIHEKQKKYLDPLLKYMINPSYAELNYNVPFVRKAAITAVCGATALVACGILTAKLINELIE